MKPRTSHSGETRREFLKQLGVATTKVAGGPDCLWVGMNSGSISSQSRSFRDYKEICARAEIIMLDHQSRSDSEGFQHNALTGKLIHGLLGRDKLIPESMPMYQMGRPTFRLASKPEPEARMWMLAGFAGGIQPWWHHVSAYHEDRRMYLTAEPVLRWHKANEQYLVNRRPVANVGVVWSQRNTDFYGRNNAEELVDQPWRGFTQALIRAEVWLHFAHVAAVAKITGQTFADQPPTFFHILGQFPRRFLLQHNRVGQVNKRELVDMVDVHKAWGRYRRGGKAGL